MKKAGALASALRSSGSTVAALATPTEPEEAPRAPAGSLERQQPSRVGRKPITVHNTAGVRSQLKALAGEEGRDVADMVAEGLNLLFAKYRKPELAPRKIYK